jgi:hypothetical protein
MQPTVKRCSSNVGGSVTKGRSDKDLEMESLEFLEALLDGSLIMPSKSPKVLAASIGLEGAFCITTCRQLHQPPGHLGRHAMEYLQG